MSASARCSAAILAGGRGRRLGGTIKPLLMIGGIRIIDRQHECLRGLSTTVAIVTPDPVPFEALGLTVWADEVPGLGPLAGLLTALTRSPEDVTLVVAGDMPFVSRPLLRRLADRAAGVDAAVPHTAAGSHPLCAAYRRSCLQVVRHRLADDCRSMRDLLPHLRVRTVDTPELESLGDPDRLLFNVNTPEDYGRGVALAADAPDPDSSISSPHA